MKGKQRRMEMNDVVTGRGGKLFKEKNAGILIQFCINEQTRWKYLYVLELAYVCVQLYIHSVHIYGTRVSI